MIKQMKHYLVTAMAQNVMSVAGSSEFWYWRGATNLTGQQFYSLLLFLGNNNTGWVEESSFGI